MENSVTLRGEKKILTGNTPKLHEKAPDFAMTCNFGHSVNRDTFKGRVVILSVVPNINTSVCDVQTRAFNEKLAAQKDIKLVTVAKNTAEEFNAWCGAKGLELTMLTDATGDFGKNYGVLLEDLGLLTRAIFVLDKEGNVTYSEIVKEVTHEPNYDAALEAAKKLL